MKKPAKSAAGLQLIALREIRRHPDCEDVQGVVVTPIIDERANCNWSIAISDLGNADAYSARRVALVVHEKLSAQYDLVRSDSGDVHRGTWRLRG
jgi:hypothetical protein